MDTLRKAALSFVPLFLEESKVHKMDHLIDLALEISNPGLGSDYPPLLREVTSTLYRLLGFLDTPMNPGDRLWLLNLKSKLNPKPTEFPNKYTPPEYTPPEYTPPEYTPSPSCGDSGEPEPIVVEETGMSGPSLPMEAPEIPIQKVEFTFEEEEDESPMVEPQSVEVILEEDESSDEHGEPNEQELLEFIQEEGIICSSLDEVTDEQLREIEQCYEESLPAVHSSQIIEPPNFRACSAYSTTYTSCSDSEEESGDSVSSSDSTSSSSEEEDIPPQTPMCNSVRPGSIDGVLAGLSGAEAHRVRELLLQILKKRD